MLSGAGEMAVGNSPFPTAESETVSAAAAGAFLAYAQARGADRGAVLAGAGLSETDFEDRDGRITLSAYLVLIRAAKASLDDPALCLRFGCDADFARISIAGVIANGAETMRDALRQLNRFGKLAVDVRHDGAERFDYRVEAGSHWVVDRRVEPALNRELSELSFSFLIAGPRAFLPAAHVQEIELVWPEPGYAAVYRELWRCPVRFGAGRNAARVDPVLMRHPVRLEPDFVASVLSEHAEKQLDQLAAAETFRGRVEAAILPILSTGTVTADGIADRLNLSRQTLYRRLKAEDTTFEEVLDALRERLARHYLDAQAFTVAETAYRVGFSDPSAFSRAFKRWTGRTPGAAKRG